MSRFGTRTRTVTVPHPKLPKSVRVRVTLSPSGEVSFHRPVRRVTDEVIKMGWAKIAWFRYTEQAKTFARAAFFTALAEALVGAIEEMVAQRTQAIRERQGSAEDGDRAFQPKGLLA